MVELAIVIALFITMSLAIMEFTFAFAQNNEIHHAAREGARAAAVGCDGVAAANASLSILDPADVSVVVVNGTPTADAGSTGTVHLSTTYQPITGFFDAMIGGASLTSDLTFYSERILPGSGAGC